MNRRDFFRYSGVLAGSALLSGLPAPQVAMAGTEDFWSRDRALWLKRKSTGEEFYVVFWTDGRLDIDNYIRLCYLLRDVNEHATVQMDVNLLNLFYGIQHWAQLLRKRDIPLVLHSGFRTDNTNSRTEGAAKFSEHKNGRAGDYILPGFSNTELANMTSFFNLGGVGLYSTHVHGDTGSLFSQKTGLRRQWVVPTHAQTSH